MNTKTAKKDKAIIKANCRTINPQAIINTYAKHLANIARTQAAEFMQCKTRLDYWQWVSGLVDGTYIATMLELLPRIKADKDCQKQFKQQNRKGL